MLSLQFEGGKGGKEKEGGNGGRVRVYFFLFFGARLHFCVSLIAE